MPSEPTVSVKKPGSSRISRGGAPGRVAAIRVATAPGTTAAANVPATSPASQVARLCAATVR
ncbi:hypothetical protein ABT093_19295 [Kitasatospora sp. NPDC002551]|uniref:hypothetical protein n=1 Tax=unclassified Kitasatospora TaxID=2633591 RepID=UPI003318091E